MTELATQNEPNTGCCNVSDCTRKDPIHLYRADFSGRIYAVTAARKVRSKEDGTAVFAAVHRHEITAQMVSFLRRNEVWVRRILDERGDDESD